MLQQKIAKNGPRRILKAFKTQFTPSVRHNRVQTESYPTKIDTRLSLIDSAVAQFWPDRELGCLHEESLFSY